MELIDQLKRVKINDVSQADLAEKKRMFVLESKLGQLQAHFCCPVSFSYLVFSSSLHPDHAMNRSMELKEERIKVLEDRLEDALSQNRLLKEDQKVCGRILLFTAWLIPL